MTLTHSLTLNYSDTMLKVFVIEPEELPEGVDHDVYCNVVALSFNEVLFDLAGDYEGYVTVIELG